MTRRSGPHTEAAPGVTTLTALTRIDRQATTETARRTAAVARLLAHANNGRVQLDPALIASLARLAASSAIWAARAEARTNAA